MIDIYLFIACIVVLLLLDKLNKKSKQKEAEVLREKVEGVVDDLQLSMGQINSRVSKLELTARQNKTKIKTLEDVGDSRLDLEELEEEVK